MTPACGLFIPEELPGAQAVELATGLDGRGFESVWFTENDRDPFPRMSAVIAHTRHLEVGSAVAMWSRSPVLAAMTAGELQELSGGRLWLGLGIGSAERNEGFYGIPHVRLAARMSEYIHVLRQAWSASDSEPLSFDGRFFRIRGFRQPYFQEGPPILVAAVQARMLRMAGQHADGVVFNPASTPWYCRGMAADEISAGARGIGRALDRFRRVVCVRCAVASDRRLAREWARRSIVAYARFPVHRRMYELHGFAPESAALTAAITADDGPGALSAVSGEMVDAFAVAGTADDALRQMRRWSGVVDTVAILPATSGMDLQEVRANIEAIVETFGG